MLRAVKGRRFENAEIGQILHKIFSPDNNSQSGSEPVGWDVHLKAKPHSNDKCRKLLDPAIKTIKHAIDRKSADWENPGQLPSEIFDWFEGQRAILFYEAPVQGLDDISNVLEKCKLANPGFNVEEGALTDSAMHSLAGLLYQLMLVQRDHLETRIGMNQDLKHSRMDGSIVDTTCPCGTYRAVDEQPWFTTAMPGRGYVMRYLRGCKQSECSGRSRMQPVSANLRGVADSKAHLRIEKNQHEEAKFYPILRMEKDLPQTRASVFLHCKHCTTQSKFRSRGDKVTRNTHLDNSTRWTLGNRRPAIRDTCYLLPTLWEKE